MLRTDASGDQDICILKSPVDTESFQTYSKYFNNTVLQSESRVVVESCEVVLCDVPASKGSNYNRCLDDEEFIFLLRQSASPTRSMLFWARYLLF